MRIRDVVRGTGVLILASVFALGLTGCDAGPNENPVSIGVTNPDPNDPLYGVTLENEAQNLGKIQAGNGIEASAKK